MSYNHLAEQLRSAPGREAPFTFREVEQVIGRSLPASARKHQAWWANTPSHSHAASWMKAGWRTARLDLAGERVTFVRDSEPGREPAQSVAVSALPTPPACEAAITLHLDRLPGATRRLLDRYIAERGGDAEAAVAAMMRHAVLSEGRRLSEETRRLTVLGPDSTPLIREDRDAR